MKDEDSSHALRQLGLAVEGALYAGLTIEELTATISTAIARFRGYEPSNQSQGIRSAIKEDYPEFAKFLNNPAQIAQARRVKEDSSYITTLTGWPPGIRFLQWEIQNCDYCGRFSRKSPMLDCNLHGYNGSLTRERHYQEKVNKKNWPKFRSPNSNRPGYCICEYNTDGQYWLINPTCPAHQIAAAEAMKSGLSVWFAKDEFFTAVPIGITMMPKFPPITGPALGNLAQAAKEAAEAVKQAGSSLPYPVDNSFFASMAKYFNPCICLEEDGLFQSSPNCPIHGDSR